ncbi:MAG: hypothetical protein QOH64_2043 [Acidimicrobiaceae bacterium]
MLEETTPEPVGHAGLRDPSDRRSEWSAGARVALQAWVVARVIVLAALGFSRYIADHIGTLRPISAQAVHQGLFSWDAAWYSDIATKGYSHLPQEALRFFPGLPIASRVVGNVVGDRFALAAISNLAALVAGILLYQLIRFEGRDARLAERAVWFLALAPPAFVFVMGYTDSTTVALAIATMYALRTRRWGWAFVAAFVAGLCRPTAFLLAVPAAVEALRDIRDVSWAQRAQRVVAVVAAPLGTLTYLLWVRSQYDSLFLPFRVQTVARLRGEFANPFTTLYDAAKGIFHEHVGTALHVPWFLLLVVLTVVVFRRWPLAYGAFAAVVVASSVTSSNLDSLERYALLAFPLVIAAAELTKPERVERVVFILVPVAMFGYATLAFLGLIGP